MGLRLPDILGLTIGFSLGGVALAAYLTLEKAPRPPTDESRSIPIVAPESSVAPPRSDAIQEKRPQTAEPRVTVMPHVIRPNPAVAPSAPSAVRALPNIQHPTDRTKPGSISGTGFFIANDGTILTAAHVVDECRGTRIVSAFLKPAEAEILATDSHHDLALLRARVRPPALLGLTKRPTGNRDLVVFGYPSQGDALVPTEALARARPDMAQRMGWPREKSPGMWLDAAEVRPGFSGGPVINADGEAIGLIMAIIRRSSTTTAAEPIPSGVAIGPDTSAITAFLRREAPGIEPGGDWKQQASDTLAARKAVVHVYCLR